MVRFLSIALVAAALALAPTTAEPAIDVLRVTVAATATVIYAVPDNRARTVLVRNPSSVSVYFGNSDVTTSNGFEIAAGNAASFVLEPDDTLYGVVATGTQVVHRVVGVYK